MVDNKLFEGYVLDTGCILSLCLSPHLFPPGLQLGGQGELKAQDIFGCPLYFRCSLKFLFEGLGCAPFPSLESAMVLSLVPPGQLKEMEVCEGGR